MDRRFGVEIEMVPNLPKHSIVRAIEKCNEPIQVHEGWASCRTESEIARWHVKTDGSVTGGRYYHGGGWELVTPALKGEAGLSRLANVLKMVRHHASYIRDKSLPLVDRSTGLHVHVEIKDFTPVQLARLVWLFARFQDELFGLAHPSRRNSQYCRPILVNVERESLEQVRSMDDLKNLLRYGCMDAHSRTHIQDTPFNDRRHGLNLTNFATYGTVEFRLKEATLNTFEILDWVRLLLAIVERAKQEIKVPDTSKVWTLVRLMRLIGWERKAYKERLGEVQRRLLVWREMRTPQAGPYNAARTSYDVYGRARTSTPVPESVLVYPN